MKIYLAHPISGSTPEEVLGYYGNMIGMLSDIGYEVLCPMKGKAKLRVEGKYQAEFTGKNYVTPIVTNHSVFNRDRWMVRQADIVYADLIGAKRVSIGTMMELAWASELGKYVVLAMEDDNIHNHAFVREAAHTIFQTNTEAHYYLADFARAEL